MAFFVSKETLADVREIVTKPLLGVVLLAGLGFVLHPWLKRHAFVFAILVVCIFALVVLFVLFKVIQTGIVVLKDRAQLRQFTSSTALTRARIAADFHRFQTRWGRIRYVRWLRDAQIQPLGVWPDARPNIDDDAASSMLALLDGHWLGIED
jgi:hypothetical protein